MSIRNLLFRISRKLLNSEADDQNQDILVEYGFTSLVSTIKTHIEITASIVAVHGLGGHARNSWTSKDEGYFWLGEIAKTKYLEKNVRVFTYGYDASIAFGRSIGNFTQHADALLDCLNGQRSNEHAVRRPIVFICHSLGGIVVKKALLNAHNNRAEYGKIFESVYGIIFLGTPHQGSDAAIAGTKIVKTVSFGSRRKPSALLKSLRTNSEALETISNDFQHHVSGDLRKVKKIVSFYEQIITPKFRSVIVTRNSAVLHLAGDIETQVPLAVDHAGLCKFSSANDQNFRTVSRHIGRLVEGARIRHEDTLARDYADLGKRLHKVHYEAHHEEILARKSDNTLKWVIQHQTFINWKGYRKSRILWLNGEVGSGKTITAASLINELQEECKAIFGPGHRPLVLYFFCDGKETAKSDPSNVLEALLHQVLVQWPPTGYEIDRQIRKAEKQFSLTVTNGIKILQQALSNIPQTYIILDAIDECGGEKAALLSGLFGIVRESSSVNLLVTTRPHPGADLKPVIEKFSDNNFQITRMTLAEEYVSRDIERYLSQKVEEFPRIKHLDSKLKDRVRDTILLQASGIFLWASLAWEMFADFSDEWTVKGVEKRLEMLHGLGHAGRQSSQHQSNSTSGKEATLYGFYDAILNRIPARQRESSKKLFRFLVFAQTPLNLVELKVAYTLHESHSSSVSLRDDLPVGDFEDEVKSKCCPFIKIVGASQTVKLVHQSIKEFFLDGDHKDYCFTSEQDRAHLDISISCLTFLCFSDFSRASSLPDPAKEAEEDFRRIEAYPFLKYSALYWFHHAMQVGSHPRLWDIFLRFTRSGASMNLAFRILWYSGGRGPFPHDTSPMHVLCFLGLGKLVKDAFKAARGATAHSLDWATTDTPDCIGRTPLHWAAINGHAGVIDALLEEGADTQVKAPVDEHEGLTCTPLDLAVEYGHLNATKLLLKGPEYLIEHSKLLKMAVAGGHTELVTVIFSPDNTSDLGPALHAAVYGDHMDTVKYLLRLGARVDSNNQQHGTPLYVATFEGNLNMVKLLLAEGADPNAKGGVHGTALQAAAYRNSQDIAIELLQQGADVNARGGQHGSPLEAAEFIGQMEMVGILRDHGAVSREDAIVRRASVIDPASAIAIEMVEKEIMKGRLGGIEKRAIKFNKDFLKAIESGNLRTVEVMLNVGLKFFKFAVKSDSEGFLVFIVKTAMQLLQTAVKNEFHQGIETLTKLYTKALAFALVERGSALVGQLLQECLKEFNTLVEEGKDGDAENLVVAGIEILVTVSGAGNKDLMQVMTEKWIQAFENLINGRFEHNLVRIIDGYASRWIIAVEQHDTAKVIAWGTVATEALSAASLGKQKRVAKCLSDLFSQRLQEVFDHESNELGTWLFNTCQWEFSQADMSIIQNGQVTKIWTFALDFLLATESTGRRKRDCQASQARVLRLGASFFNAVTSSGLLNLLAEITRTVVVEKFSDCVDKTHVLLLMEDISRVIDAINTLYQGTELEGVMSSAQTDLKHTAGQIIVSRWG